MTKCSIFYDISDICHVRAYTCRSFAKKMSVLCLDIC